MTSSTNVVQPSPVRARLTSLVNEVSWEPASRPVHRSLGGGNGLLGESPDSVVARSVEAQPRILTLDARWDGEPSTALWFNDQVRELSLASASAGGADDESESTPVAENPFSKAYLKLLLTDIKETFSAPAHWDACDWLIAGGVAAGIGTLAVFDEDIQRAVQSYRNSTLDKVSNDIQPFGAEYAAGVLGAFYVGGLAFDNTRAKQVALDGAAASLIASGLILYPVKYTVGRSRPGSNQGAYHFQPFSGHDSFPSGHSTEAFAVATVISEHYDSIWITLGSYGVAGMVGYARLNNNYHWASDVFAGAALGTFVGHVVVHVNRKHWRVSLQPILSPGLQGGEMAVSF